ncbi:MAG: glycosyltransferase [Bacteroidales bacterium]
MKICFVANAESIHTLRWVNYFINKGHDVHVISHKGREIKGATFHCLKTFGNSKISTERIRPIDLITFITRAFQTRKIIKKIKPDIVHAHNVILGGFYATRIQFHPLVVTAWGTDVLIAPKVSFLLKKIVKLVLKRADILTCDGRNTEKAMIRLGAEAKKIKIIYFGIDTKKNTPEKRNEKLREKLNINDAYLVISLRSFNPIYNIETLIKAIPLVLDQNPNVRFILAGTGEQELKLKDLAVKLGVEKNTIFTGSLTEKEIPIYLASSDLYVSTSLSDSGLAASTGEAMACGLPVISTDVGAISDWINDGEGGFIIPAENPDILANRIIFLLKNKDLMKKFGEINRNTITEKQDYYKEMQKMEKICEELISNYK